MIESAGRVVAARAIAGAVLRAAGSMMVFIPEYSRDETQIKFKYDSFRIFIFPSKECFPIFKSGFGLSFEVNGQSRFPAPPARMAGLISGSMSRFFFGILLRLIPVIRALQAGLKINCRVPPGLFDAGGIEKLAFHPIGF